MDDDMAVERVLRSAREVVGEVMPGLERRWKWSTEEKLRILAQSVAPGSSPALTCKMHGISSGQLYTWRKQFRHGALTGFVPVSITPEPVALSASEPLLALPPQPPAVEPAPDVNGGGKMCQMAA
jgi:transposase